MLRLLDRFSKKSYRCLFYVVTQHNNSCSGVQMFKCSSVREFERVRKSSREFERIRERIRERVRERDPGRVRERVRERERVRQRKIENESSREFESAEKMMRDNSRGSSARLHTPQHKLTTRPHCLLSPPTQSNSPHSHTHLFNIQTFPQVRSYRFFDRRHLPFTPAPRQPTGESPHRQAPPRPSTQSPSLIFTKFPRSPARSLPCFFTEYVDQQRQSFSQIIFLR